MKNFISILTATLLHLCLMAQTQPAGPASESNDSLALKTIRKNEARKNMMAQARMDAWESLRNSGQLNRPDTTVKENPIKRENRQAGRNISSPTRPAATSNPVAVTKHTAVKKKTVAHKPAVIKKPVAKKPVAKKPVAKKAVIKKPVAKKPAAISKTTKKKTVSPQRTSRKPAPKQAAKTSRHPATHQPVARKKQIHAPKKPVSGKIKSKPVAAPKKPVKKQVS
jgi:hypothetical protein